MKRLLFIFLIAGRALAATGGPAYSQAHAGGVTVGSGSGTVTSVSVVTANGVSGSVATATTTPAITLTLGDITPTTVNASGSLTGTNLIVALSSNATLYSDNSNANTLTLRSRTTANTTNQTFRLDGFSFEFYTGTSSGAHTSLSSTGGLSLPGSLSVGGGTTISKIRIGTATLTTGSVVVSDAAITANSEIFVGLKTTGGTVGAPYVSSKTASTGFTITSTSALDTSVVAYQILEP